MLASVSQQLRLHGTYGMDHDNKAVHHYRHALEFVPECYKAHEMCDNAVDTHPSTIRFVPEYYKTQEMCYKAVHRCFFCI